MAHSRVVDLDADLVGLGRRDLDVLEGEGLAGLPGNGGLAGDGLRGARVALAWLTRSRNQPRSRHVLAVGSSRHGVFRSFARLRGTTS